MYHLEMFHEDEDNDDKEIPGSREVLKSFVTKPADYVLEGWLKRHGIYSDVDNRRAILNGDSVLMNPRGQICELVHKP